MAAAWLSFYDGVHYAFVWPETEKESVVKNRDSAVSEKQDAWILITLPSVRFVTGVYGPG